jgi:hypothetical protein
VTGPDDNAGDQPDDQRPRGRYRRREHPGRSQRVHIRLSDKELEVIARAAGRARLTPSSYCAQVALAAATGATVPEASPLRDALVELMGARTQLRRLGTNVNQAVARLHATGQADAGLAAAVAASERAVARVDRAAERVMGQLG